MTNSSDFTDTELLEKFEAFFSEINKISAGFCLSLFEFKDPKDQIAIYINPISHKNGLEWNKIYLKTAPFPENSFSNSKGKVHGNFRTVLKPVLDKFMENNKFGLTPSHFLRLPKDDAYASKFTPPIKLANLSAHEKVSLLEKWHSAQEA